MDSAVAKGDSLYVRLCAILPNATPDEEATLFVFELRNERSEKYTWWYDESTLVDAEGTEHELGTSRVRGLSEAHADFLPNSWKTSPRIPSNTRTPAVTDLVDPNDDIQPREIRYEYDGVSYTIELDAETVEGLREHPSEFVERDWNARDNGEARAVAVVEQVVDNRVILDTGASDHGVVVPKPHFRDESLSPGDRVGVSDDERIKEVLTSGTDYRVDTMIVEESPETTFDDVGGLEEVKRRVEEVVELPLMEPERITRVGVEPPNGVLLHGPPGTGKTLIARAVAGEVDASFLELSAGELVRKYIGEGGQLVRDLFERARETAPSVVFIDELDAVATSRTQAENGEREVERTLTQLLAAMDGFDPSGDVRVLAATNRPDRLDPAVLRPGRFDRIVEVPAPDVEGRQEILSIHTAPLNTADNLSLEEAAAHAPDGTTGAQLAKACTEAGYTVLREDRTEVEQVDLLRAIQRVGDQSSVKSLPDHTI